MLLIFLPKIRCGQEKFLYKKGRKAQVGPAGRAPGM